MANTSNPSGYHFSGYATRNDTLCSDGRIIRKNAFIGNDGTEVPIVWEHFHNEPSNVIGHALLRNREDGVYAYCTLNDSPKGEDVKRLVKNRDIKALSIYANKLQHANGKEVIHGTILEVSTVLAGANPGAKIDEVYMQHSDGSETVSPDEFIFNIAFEEASIELYHAADGKPGADVTVQQVFDSMTPLQLETVYAVIGELTEAIDTLQNALPEAEAVKHSATQEEEQTVQKNVFDSANKTGAPAAPTFTSVQFSAMMDDTINNTGSLKQSVLKHATTYGIDNIDMLFPDAHELNGTPVFIQRRTEWVQAVLGGARHTPFSRIRTTFADITNEEARALGYPVMGEQKRDEFFSLLQRETTPTTVYKRQRFDRDNILDVSSFAMLSWVKAEMRLMLDEELARAMLITDGRASNSPDKIKEANVRSIYKDADLYVLRERIPADITAMELVDAMIEAREDYKGSGTPDMFITTKNLNKILLIRDTLNRRIYQNRAALADELNVGKIIEVPLMTGVSRQSSDTTPVTLNLHSIFVNMNDYVIGADKGGEVTFFDNFDMNVNQQIYLLETRISAALVKPASAIVFEQEAA